MLKYKLIIEGTEKEVAEAKSQHCDHRVVWNLMNSVVCEPYYHKHSPRILPEYKVVEPLRFEFTTEIKDDGMVPVYPAIQSQLRQIARGHEGKKVKVVISEETD